MGQPIQVRRGNEANLPVLQSGEPAFTLDTKKVFIGSPAGNVELPNKAEIDAQLAEKATKDDVENIEVPITKYAHLVVNNDWSGAISATINELQTNQTLAVPFGDYEFSQNIVCTKKINIKCDGTLIFTGVGVAFTYGAEGAFILDVDLKIKLKNKTLNWSVDTTGFKAYNIGSAHLDVDITNFKKGLELCGRSGGCQYNTIYLKTLYNNQENLRFVADNPSGWINQNTVIGGRFGWQSGLDYTDCVHINMVQISTYKINNNTVYSSSFECADTVNRGGKAFIINGYHNSVYNCRYEGVKYIEFGESSNYNTIENGYELSAVTLLGLSSSTQNTVNHRDSKKFTGANSSKAVNVFKNVYSSTAKAFAVENNSGTETLYATSDGKLIANSYGYFQNGVRFSTSDLTNNDRGIFVGTGSPEGVIAARPGSIYLNVSGGTGTTLYVKESFNTASGWVAK